jgi:polyisoprenyl-phosphate glycosyltransferase
MLSILTPAYNESVNLDRLYARITHTMTALGGDWEWLVVDDHSADGTFAVIQRLAAADPHVRGIRLARNSGSHIAITCGLHHVRGDAAVMMASDLQDPPETLGALLERWGAGAQVVWAVRRERPGDASHAGFAAIYYWIMRNVVGMREMPARGADFFLVDRRVIDAFCRVRERNASVFALITWLGFRQEYVEYDKQPRAAGRSGWTMARKIKLVMDSVTGFSEMPIRLCSYVGVALLCGAFITAVMRLILPFGVATLLLSAMVALTGLQLLALGIVGEYVGRALDEARQRPPYFIEQYAGEPGAADMAVENR